MARTNALELVGAGNLWAGKDYVLSGVWTKAAVRTDVWQRVLEQQTERMSVSVDFFLEVRHDGKWTLLRWKQPTELETYFRDQEKRKWETMAEIFSCDYCFVEEFIEDYSQRLMDGLCA